MGLRRAMKTKYSLVHEKDCFVSVTLAPILSKTANIITGIFVKTSVARGDSPVAFGLFLYDAADFRLCAWRLLT